MYKSAQKVFINKSLLNSQILGSALILTYCLAYGVTSYVVLAGLQLIFFLTSLVFALSIVYVRDPIIRKQKIKKGILYNQLFGGVLVLAYVLIFGASSFALLSGFQLIFFMSSYIFAMSLFYIRDPERIKKSDEVVSSTYSPFIDRNPCFINNKDLSWLVRELNGSLSTIIGFSELMLKRDHSDSEKEYMLRNIYEKAISLSNTVVKAAGLVDNSEAKPKDICEKSNLREKVTGL